MTDQANNPSDNNQILMSDAIKAWVAALAAADGIQRWHARKELVQVGPPAVPALTTALKSPNATVRWEAAKALGSIRDPRAAPALVDALEDPQSAVRWLAALALIAVGRAGLIPLLKGVEHCSDSVWMQEGTRHVLHHLVQEGRAPEAAPVLEALEDIEPVVEAPIAAYHVLQELDAR